MRSLTCSRRVEKGVGSSCSTTLAVGFGAAFGPIIVFSLFWWAMTARAAIGGMLTGALTVVFWSNLEGGIFDLYEIVPGFLLASLAILGISVFKPEQNEQVLAEFEAVEVLRLAD